MKPMQIFPITIPPLRERGEDIPQLVDHFLEKNRQHQGKPLPGLSKTALDLLMAHDWPGNIRELRNLLEYATIVTNGDLIQPEHLRLQNSGSYQEESANDRISINLSFTPEEFSLDAVNRHVVEWAMNKCNNNKSSAARLLKASRKLFY